MIYVLVDEDMNTWECSNCREWWTLVDGTPKSNKMRYCPFCGQEIKGEVIETIEDLIEKME